MSALQTIFVGPLKGIDMAKIIEEAMEIKEQQILDLNRAQLDRGIDAAGKSLGRYANFKYKNRFEPVDLKLTGEFRRKFTLSRSKSKKEAEIFSQDEKQAKLEKKYGKDIQGLTSTNKEVAGDIILPEMQKLYRRAVVDQAIKSRKSR